MRRRPFHPELRRNLCIADATLGPNSFSIAGNGNCRARNMFCRAGILSGGQGVG